MRIGYYIGGTLVGLFIMFMIVILIGAGTDHFSFRSLMNFFYGTHMELSYYDREVSHVQPGTMAPWGVIITGVVMGASWFGAHMAYLSELEEQKKEEAIAARIKRAEDKIGRW